LNSTPPLLARERRAVAQGAELGPGDLRIDAAAQAAVGAGDDVLLVHEFGERDDAIGYGEAERGQESFLDEEALDAIV
jgi:hypothetical protein